MIKAASGTSNYRRAGGRKVLLDIGTIFHDDWPNRVFIHHLTGNNPEGYRKSARRDKWA
jgi:hypothetical protein